MRALHWRGFWLSGGAALVLLVTFLCLRPSTGGEQLFPNADKWAHFLAFFALAGMLLALVERRYYASVCLGLLAFGGAIEIAQYLLPYGRSAEWLDLAADGVGIVAGWLVSVPFRESWLQRIERWLGVRG
jgi:VanZ family protein